MAELAARNARDPDFDSPYIREAVQEGLDLPLWEKLAKATFKVGWAGCKGGRGAGLGGSGGRGAGLGGSGGRVLGWVCWARRLKWQRDGGGVPHGSDAA